MSTKKPFLPAILAILGLLGLAAAEPADPLPSETPTESAPASVGTPEPSDEPDAATPGSQQEDGVILLKDGQVVQGTIIRDDEGYLIKTPSGSKRFPRRRIEQTFSTLQEAYQYKASQFPDEDVQERLKLAQWCLAQNMETEARTQLNGILRINPKHIQAKAMLEKLDATQVRLAKQRQLDPGVRQAQATPGDIQGDGSPQELDPAALGRSGAQTRSMASGIAEVPNIFNLPRPTALRLSEEFNRSVHPILQRHCAKCHNERYPGMFQLRQVRSPRDLNRDTLNLNLDATLQLIDPSNPSRSEILTTSLRTHGIGKTKRPIFRASNDPSYLKLSQWVENICKPLGRDAIQQTSAQADPANVEERFAADRTPNLGLPSDDPGASASSIPPSRMNVPDFQSPRRVPQSPAQAVAGPNEFPLTNLTGNAAPASGTIPNSGAGTQPAMSPATRTAVAIPQTSAATATAPSATPAATPRAPVASASAQPAPGSSPVAGTAPTAKKPKAAVKIDPAALERLLKARNGGSGN
ncbi:MAG: hypothetical protein ABS79_07940 [Planctomycetes bacterium SCN 63-9]|nr:MAG: hypothetical protein ABS79_07940 [Planctomycetes bacterium SCN 63-9]